MATQKLFPEFQRLRAWHFRYILGSWHSDADLAWRRAYLLDISSTHSFNRRLQLWQFIATRSKKTAASKLAFNLWSRSRENVDRQYKQPDAIGRSARMVKYKPYNETWPTNHSIRGHVMQLWRVLYSLAQDKGVSVQEGLRFYDGQIATMPVMLDYGGGYRARIRKRGLA